MKRILRNIFLTVFTAGIATGANAQMLNESFNRTLVPKTAYPKNINSQQSSRVVQCGTDTIIYPYYKEIVFSSPNDSFFVDAMVGTVRAASQAYILNDTVNVLGVQFWGNNYTAGTSTQPLIAKAMLYTVDATFKPLVAIDSALVTITNTYNFYEAYFTAPRTVTDTFAVVVKNAFNDTLGIVTNNAGATWQTPDYSESLAWRRFGSGVWNSTQAFFGQDMEYMIFPIVNYDIAARFTTANDTVCEGTAVNFTNTSSPILQNRMFNLYEFGEYFNSDLDSTFLWNYDNGTWQHTMNGSTTYSTPGVYQPELFAYQLGYYMFCADSMTMTLNVMPDVMAGFSVDASNEPMIEVNDASTGEGTTWYMYGDGSMATTDTTHMYTANGTYTITQIATGFCGADTTTQQVTIMSVGISSFEKKIAVSFRNDIQSLVIDAPSSSTVEVFDMVGKVVYSDATGSRTSRVNLTSLTEGTYIARVKSADQTKTIRFVLVK